MSNQITAYNLSNDDELGFFGDSPLICPEWAVVYGYAEEKNLLSKAFRIIQDHPDELVACVFQTKVATDSRRSLPPIPRESCH